MLRMLVLSIRQQLVEMELLLVMNILREFRLVSVELPLSDLLIDPVLLL